jgi:hypothetical protein
MKRQGSILRTIMLSTFVLLALGIGHAQYAVQTIKVTIPFNFSIGAQRFWAGEYTLKPVPSLQHSMLLQSQAGQTLIYVGTNFVQSREAPTSATLVFNQYGRQYCLSQIWEAGNGMGRQLTKSRLEIEMAKVQHSQGQEVAQNFVTEH